MKTCSPSSHIVDSRFYATGYTTNEARMIFCDLHRYQRWLDVEVALAQTQADLGIIPTQAARVIKDCAKINKLDLDLIEHELRITGHSLMPLLTALHQACGDEAGRFIHFGATTQDIQDTAQILEIRDVLTIVERDLFQIIGHVVDLCEKYMDLVTIGRTHNQHALPTTMGLKMAVWLDELWRHAQRLEQIKKRVLVSQLFGGVGTMDGFGDQALELLHDFSARLGLRVPRLAWHSSRDRITEYLTLMAMIAGTCAGIAEEIRCLARNEINEMTEPFQPGKIGSSTMPHKRNPEMCEQVVVLSRLITSRVSPAFEGQINEHERDYRAVRLEWVTITDTSLYICGLLGLTRTILDGLVVHEDRIRRNVEAASPQISTEALMFFLAPTMGKQAAHTLIYETAMQAVESGRPFLDLLFENSRIAEQYSREEISEAIRPENHIGMARRLTQQTVAEIKEKLGQDKAPPNHTLSCPLLAKEKRCCR